MRNWCHQENEAAGPLVSALRMQRADKKGLGLKTSAPGEMPEWLSVLASQG